MSGIPSRSRIGGPGTTPGVSRLPRSGSGVTSSRTPAAGTCPPGGGRPAMRGSGPLATSSTLRFADSRAGPRQPVAGGSRLALPSPITAPRPAGTRLAPPGSQQRAYDPPRTVTRVAAPQAAGSSRLAIPTPRTVPRPATAAPAPSGSSRLAIPTPRTATRPVTAAPAASGGSRLAIPTPRTATRPATAAPAASGGSRLGIPTPRTIARPAAAVPQERRYDPAKSASQPPVRYRGPGKLKPTKLFIPTPGGAPTPGGGAVGKVCKPPPAVKKPAIARKLEGALLAAQEKKPLSGHITRRTNVPPPQVQTACGLVNADFEGVITRTVTKAPGMPEVVGSTLTATRTTSPRGAERVEVTTAHVGPKPPMRAPHPDDGPQQVITQTKMVRVGDYTETSSGAGFEGEGVRTRLASVLPTPAEVARLVREETALVDETLGLPMLEVKHISPATYPIRKKAVSFALDSPATLEHLEDHPLCSICPAAPQEPPPDETPPEVIADMLNSEERGLPMGEEPKNIIQFLFNTGSEAEPSIEVTSAAAYPLQDVVVPGGDVPNLEMTLQNIEDIVNVSVNAEITLSQAPPPPPPAEEGEEGEEEGAASVAAPSTTTYCEVVGDAPLSASKNAAKKGGATKRKRVKPLASEPPPWGAIDDDKVESIIDLVGGPLAPKRAAPVGTGAEGQEEEPPDPFVEGIEYILQMDAPSHFSQVQLRGAQMPNWFPGYLMALPDQQALVTVARSPSEVFAAAWRATQPDIFAEDDIFVI